MRIFIKVLGIIFTLTIGYFLATCVLIGLEPITISLWAIISAVYGYAMGKLFRIIDKKFSHKV